MEDKYLFSTRDIVEAYPNNIGLQKTLTQFINQIKLRHVKSRMIRVNSYSPQIKVSYFNSKKLKKAIEDYIATSTYKVCGERKQNLKSVLDLINIKIEKEELGVNNE